MSVLGGIRSRDAARKDRVVAASAGTCRGESAIAIGLMGRASDRLVFTTGVS